MVQTRTDSFLGTYRKVVAAQESAWFLTSATNFTSPSWRKTENKYARGNPVCVRPTPKGKKKLESSSDCPLKILIKNRIPEEAGSSGLGKGKRKVHSLPSDDTDDEKK